MFVRVGRRLQPLFPRASSGFYHDPMRDGTTAIETVSVTHLRMERMCLLPSIRVRNRNLRSARPLFAVNLLKSIIGNNMPCRERAVERRSLHGEYGIGTGQKNFMNTNLYKVESASQTSHPEEAAAEVLNMMFGNVSYARKLLERMGWEAGEALESSSKGIMEPLQAVANKGNAGLGWSNVR